MNLKLTTEFGALQAVMIHRPGVEIDRLTPDNTRKFLFEDVPYLEVMQKEHDEFTTLIQLASDARVLRLKDLMQEVFKDEKLKLEILEDLLKNTAFLDFTGEFIEKFSTAEFINMVTGGIRIRDARKKIKSKLLDGTQDHEFIIPPVPNLYFMRDPAAVIQSGVISSRMKFEGRRREPKLVRYVFSNHPEFKNKFNLVNHYADPETQGHTIEGGDVIVLSEKALAIGYSERTDKEAIMEIAKKVLADGPVERVYEVHLPAKRNFMHLDTVFTIIDENLVVTYPDAMNAVEYTVVYRKDGTGADGSITLHEEKIEYSFIDQLKKEIPYPEIVYTAGGHLDYASREQWYDGANVFALGPRKVISYNRNRHTNRALRQAGVEVLEINSSELSRGLGGPRCMTMPLKRKF